MFTLCYLDRLEERENCPTFYRGIRICIAVHWNMEDLFFLSLPSWTRAIIILTNICPFRSALKRNAIFPDWLMIISVREGRKEGNLFQNFSFTRPYNNFHRNSKCCNSWTHYEDRRTCSHTDTDAHEHKHKKKKKCARPAVKKMKKKKSK